MELFSPLTQFYKAIADDPRINATHISLYMALLQQWNLQGGENPVPILRREVMKASKISARQTYNKCLCHLQRFGYISYKPSRNGYEQSLITLNLI